MQLFLQKTLFIATVQNNYELKKLRYSSNPDLLYFTFCHIILIYFEFDI